MNKDLFKKLLVVGAALFVVVAPLITNPGVAFAQTDGTIGVTPPPTPTPIAPIPPVAAPVGSTPVTPTTGNTGATGGSAPTSQTPNFISCVGTTGNLATCSVYLMGYLGTAFMGFFVNIGAFLVRLGLQFNDNVYNSPAVTTGFSVALAIANLGFVLMIIIIAIATILRNQTYGIKQLLWKLVVMAVLVNFGLVITAPIVGLASSMSNYFITAITSGQPTTDGYEGFTKTMMTAFAPQAFQVGNTQQANATANGAAVGTGVSAGCSGVLSTVGLQGLCSLLAAGAQTAASSPSTSFVQTILAMLFDVVFSALIAFTLLTLAVLLLVRYFILAGLLIILPLAWLTYVFPKFDSSFSKWWNAFVKWTLFPPLALFFLYLAFLTATNTTANNGAATGNTYLLAAAGLPSGASTGIESSILTQTAIAGPIQQAADEVLLIGLTIMGLMFASSLSGKAGSTVVNGATNVTKVVGGYVGRGSKNAARAGLRATERRGKVVERMRTGQLGGLQRIPGLGRAASAAGRMLQPQLTSKSKLVDDAKKKVPENLEVVKQNLKGRMSDADNFAYISKLVEKKSLSNDQMVAGITVGQWLDSHKKQIEDHDFKKNAGDADKLLGNNEEMRTAQAELENAKQSGGDVVVAQDKLQKATDKFVEKLEPSEDGKKINFKDIYKTPNKGEKANPFQEVLARSFAIRQPGLASKALATPSLSSRNFKAIYKRQISDQRSKSPRLAQLDALDEQIANLKKGTAPDNDAIKQLRSEIEQAKLIKGDQNFIAGKIKQRTDKIAEINGQRLKEAEGQKVELEEALKKPISDEEENLIIAKQAFKSSIMNQATGGGHEEHEEHGGGENKEEHRA